MSQLSRTAWKALYGSTGSVFPDNTTGEISEGDMRTFGENASDSFFQKSDDSYTAPFPQVTASGTDTYTATLSPAITAYAAGQKFQILFTNANTGAATLALNALAALAITKNGTTALDAGDIQAGSIKILSYDGTRLQMIGGGTGSGSFVPLTLTGNTTIDGQGNELVLQGGAGESVKFVLDGVNNTQHALVFKTGSVVRWQLHTDNNETGSANVGSDLHIERFDDAGAYLDTPIIIDRTDGVVDFAKPPQLTTAPAAAANNTQVPTTAWVQTEIALKQTLINSATALTDAASMDLTAIKHTLATSSATRTFTISYTGDDITLEITLNTTASTLTFPATSLCVSEGSASGNNTCALAGVSGDKYMIAIKKIGSAYYVVCKNFGQ